MTAAFECISNIILVQTRRQNFQVFPYVFQVALDVLVTILVVVRVMDLT